MSMTMTKALAAARLAVSSVERMGHNYVVYGPYRDNDIDGPRTANYYGTFPQAQQARARWVATIALVLMGVDDDDAYCYLIEAHGTAAQRVAYVLRRLKRA
jgi:hypothetical protein